MTEDRHDITRLLLLGRAGDAQAQDQAMRLLYKSIKQIASQLLRREQKFVTISAPELVHEAFLRLFGDNQPEWQSRQQLLGYSARAMRQILVSLARRRKAEKRPQSAQQLRLTDIQDLPGVEVDLEQLDAVLERLEAINPRHSQIVEMKFFAGMTIEEIAAALDTSAPTVIRNWRMARAWLKRELDGSGCA